MQATFNISTPSLSKNPNDKLTLSFNTSMGKEEYVAQIEAQDRANDALVAVVKLGLNELINNADAICGAIKKYAKAFSDIDVEEDKIRTERFNAQQKNEMVWESMKRDARHKSEQAHIEWKEKLNAELNEIRTKSAETAKENAEKAKTTIDELNDLLKH